MSVTRWYRSVLLLVLSAIAPIAVVVASAHAYDPPAPARVDALASALAEPGQSLLGGSREGSATPFVKAGGTSTTPPPRNIATKALPAGSPGRVVANALEPHELALAQSVVGYRGGTFVGNSTRGAPGIDGMLDGVPASLKTYSGSSPASVLRHVSQAEASASKAGYSGVQVYVNAPGVSRSTLVDFGANGPLSQIPSQGTVSTIYVQTADGWVVFPG